MYSERHVGAVSPKFRSDVFSLSTVCPTCHSHVRQICPVCVSNATSASCCRISNLRTGNCSKDCSAFTGTSSFLISSQPASEMQLRRKNTWGLTLMVSPLVRILPSGHITSDDNCGQGTVGGWPTHSFFLSYHHAPSITTKLIQMFCIGRERRTRSRGVEPAGSCPTLVNNILSAASFY